MNYPELTIKQNTKADKGLITYQNLMPYYIEEHGGRYYIDNRLGMLYFRQIDNEWMFADPVNYDWEDLQMESNRQEYIFDLLEAHILENHNFEADNF